MGLETQAKLLRVLQEKQYERVGGNASLRADVRIIAATNQDLEAMVKQGRFREDLYYRIKVVEVRIPPVRERREDIPLMVQYFLKEACERHSIPLKQLSPDAMRRCLEQSWKGNVRSLKAAIEQAVILSSGAEITAADLFSGADENGRQEGDNAAAHESSRAGSIAGSSAASVTDVNGELPRFREAKERFIGDWERDYFIRALRLTGGNISRAAERAGMYRQSFQQKMRELEITVADLGLADEEE